MYIELYGRGDRLGANLVCFLSQIFYANHHKCYIKYDKSYIHHCDNVRFVPYNQRYNDSIFIESLFYFIDLHNAQLKDQGILYGDCIHMVTIHWFELVSKILLEIKMDYITYFRIHLYPKIESYYKERILHKNYSLPFDPSHTILIHLRLNDTRYCRDYNGIHCATHFRSYIDQDKIATNETHDEISRVYPGCNYQSPLSKYKIDHQIEQLKAKYPSHEIILVTSPGEDTSQYPYRCISSQDESYDLFLLSSCEVVVLSRSTFSLSSLFFNSIQKEVHIPLWGHLACLGLFTKYDGNEFYYFD